MQQAILPELPFITYTYMYILIGQNYLRNEAKHGLCAFFKDQVSEEQLGSWGIAWKVLFHKHMLIAELLYLLFLKLQREEFTVALNSCSTIAFTVALLVSPTKQQRSPLWLMLIHSRGNEFVQIVTFHQTKTPVNSDKSLLSLGKVHSAVLYTCSEIQHCWLNTNSMWCHKLRVGTQGKHATTKCAI